MPRSVGVSVNEYAKFRFLAGVLNMAMAESPYAVTYCAIGRLPIIFDSSYLTYPINIIYAS